MLNDNGHADETPIERLGRLVIQLLEAARDHGDEMFILVAERAAMEAGRVIARHLYASKDEAPLV